MYNLRNKNGTWLHSLTQEKVWDNITVYVNPNLSVLLNSPKLALGYVNIGRFQFLL